MKFKNQKVLVTGGTGMIGRQLVDLLLKRGAHVFVASLDEGINLPAGVSHKRVEKELGFKKQFTFEEGIAQTVKWYRENF